MIVLRRAYRRMDFTVWGDDQPIAVGGDWGKDHVACPIRDDDGHLSSVCGRVLWEQEEWPYGINLRGSPYGEDYAWKAIETSRTPGARYICAICLGIIDRFSRRV